MRKIFTTGIGTGIGKTIVSAVLTEALKADYWKPVQAGLDSETDSQTISRLISSMDSKVHPEAYRLKTPMSPHAAAARDGLQIDPKKLRVPETERTLIIEGAGGLMVPLTRDFLVLDLILQLQAEAVLVVRHYLGSINHTLLSAEILKKHNVPVAGIIYCGDAHPESEEVIAHRTGFRILGRVGQEKVFGKAEVLKYSVQFQHV